MKTIILLITLSLLSAGVLAEITINKPLLILLNDNGVKVATGSTSIEKAMEKASFLPDGVYILQRPDVTITVKQNATTANQVPVAVTGGDQTVTSGQLVWLPCNLSYDPDGQIVKCEYKQTGGTPVEIKYTPTGEAYYIAPGSVKKDTV